MFNIGPRVIVQVTPQNPTINVGNNSYFLVQGTPGKPKVRLTAGKSYGHILLIESALQHPFIMTDKIDPYKMELSGTITMKGADTLLLVWSGTRWVQVAYSKNS